MRKKAQAAMEFMMTYGWAIMIVLVTISTLTYFGVFDISRLIPQRCDITSDLRCDDYVFTDSDSQLKLKIGNSLGYDITINASTVTDSSRQELCNMLGNSVAIKHGESGEIFLSCTVSDSILTGDLRIIYKIDLTGSLHPIRGNIRVRPI